jgi:hypothetical protein
MVKNQQIQPLPAVSQLERFSLGFEFDKTLQEIKRNVRIRTM